MLEYDRLCRKADEIIEKFVQGHVRAAESQEDEWGERKPFMHIFGRHPASPAPLGMPRGVEEILRFVAHEFAADSLQYQVKFCAADDGHPRNLDLSGFVSWLIIHRIAFPGKPGLLYIVFDRNKIMEELLGQDGTGFAENAANVDSQGELNRAFNFCLSKVHLHEGAHIIEHLDYLRNRLEGGEHNPATTPAQENEAWFLALYAWSKLVGEIAEHYRSLPQSTECPAADHAWLLA